MYAGKARRSIVAVPAARVAAKWACSRIGTGLLSCKLQLGGVRALVRHSVLAPGPRWTVF